jgi:transposase
MKRGRNRWTGAGIRKLTKTKRLNLCILARMGKPTRGLARKFKVSPSTVKYWKERATGPLPR